ncbi:MAG: carboxypeptidase-like regulatory domain-containing protein [Acidobacteriota bacterium]
MSEETLGEGASEGIAGMEGFVSGDGNAQPGAEATAVHEETGTQYAALSGGDGLWRIDHMRVGGPYEVTVSAPGFASQTKDGLHLSAGEVLPVEFHLHSESIED